MLLTPRLSLRKPENNDAFGQDDFTFNADELDKLGCACRLSHSALQSIANAMQTVLAWDTEVFDTDAMHDIAVNNSRITIVTSGIYCVGFTVEFFPNATGYRQGRIRLNGGTILVQSALPSSGAGEGTLFPLSTLYRFVAGLKPTLVEGAPDGSAAWLTFPDNVDKAAVDKIVAAHDPTPAPPPPNPDLELAAAITAATTLEELKSALLGKTRPAKAAGRPVT